MVEVRMAIAEDYEDILPLLLKFNPDAEKWKSLFINHWDQEENYFGYVLTDNGKIVGYLGTIFSSRIIQGRKEKFCNLSAWIIAEEYKKHGLTLFLPVLQLEDYTITNFSSAEKTYIISKKLGFEDIGTRLVYIVPVPQVFPSVSCEIAYSKEVFEKTLKPNDLRIYKDHSKFNCHHILLQKGNGYCYLIIKKEKAFLKSIMRVNSIFQKLFRSNVIQDKLLVGRIHYISNKGLLSELFNSISFPISVKLGVIGFLADERWFNDLVKFKKHYPIFSTPVFKSATLSGEDIDTLYSEQFLLDLHA